MAIQEPGISHAEWDSVATVAEKAAKRAIAPIGTMGVGVVARVDEGRRMIWLDDYPDPVPLFGFEFEVEYYDDSSEGMTVEAPVPPATQGKIPGKILKKKAKVTLKMPKVNDYVYIYSENNRVPRCLGVLLSSTFGEDPNNFD